MARDRGLLHHCNKVYSAMDEAADESGIYTGFLTTFVQSLGYSVPYYSPIKNKLVAMGCIEQIKRGGGKLPSVWKLHRPPDEVLFKLTDDGKHRGRRVSRLDILEQRIADLERQLKNHDH